MTEMSQVVSPEENVLIEAGACSISILPSFGGKISSIRFNGTELLQAPLTAVGQRTRSMPFENGDASGWDECLPSVAACTVTTPSGSAQVPDHGDLWRVAWKLDGRNAGTATQPSSVAMRAECFSLPLALERRIDLAETGFGWRINLSYTLTNRGNSVVPWSWAAHPLFSAAPGDRVLLPESIRSLRLEGSGGNRLGNSGDSVRWPIASLPSGGETDLSIAQPPESGIGDKLFAGPLTLEENWCALERPSAGLRIRLSFDPVDSPYLGLWICHGGWPERPGPKQTCVALEPCTAPVDSLAVSGPWSRELAPGASASWTMIVDLEPL